MKQAVKWICIIAAILVALGAGLFLAGRLLGGDGMNMSFVIQGDNVTFGRNSIRITADDLITEVKEVQEFSELELSSSFIDLQVVAGDSYKVESCVPEQLTPKIKEENGKLIVEQPQTINIGFQMINCTIYYKVTVPEGTALKAAIHSTSGDIKVSDVDVSGHVSATSGDCSFVNMKGSELAAETTSGAIYLSNATYEKLDFVNTSGGITIENVTATDTAKFKNTSGGVTMDSLTGESIVVDTTSGDVRGDGIAAPKMQLNSNSGDITMKKTSVDDIAASATSGDITIKPDNDIDTYDYDITTTSGDIRVGNLKVEKKYRDIENRGRKIYASATSGNIEITD